MSVANGLNFMLDAVCEVRMQVLAQGPDYSYFFGVCEICHLIVGMLDAKLLTL